MKDEVTNAEILQAIIGINTRLDHSDQHFDNINQRFDGIDKRFDFVDQRFDGIDQRFNLVDQRFDGVDQRLNLVDQRFDLVDQRFDGMDKRFDGIDQRLDKNEVTSNEIIEAINVFSEATDRRFDSFESKTNQQFAYIKSVMVTKDYLDDKLSDLQGDLVAMSRNGNTKLTTLVGILSDRKVITINDKKKILAMEPFGRI